MESTHEGASILLVVNVGQAFNRVLLTGAGASYAWGGLLAREFRGALFNRKQVQAHDRVRQLLLGEPSFEDALAKVRAGGYIAEEIEALESAVLEVFLSMDADMSQVSYFRDGQVNVYGFQDFLKKFQCPVRSSYSQCDASYIFTLNQDLMLERKWYNFGHAFYRPGFPGVPPNRAMNRDGKSWFSTNIGSFKNEYGLVIDDHPALELQHCTNYIKLHGSFDWRRSDGQAALVIGTGKTEQIDEIPLLSAYREVFRSVLGQQGLRLMVFGYSFQDQHINEAIACGVLESALEVHIWDPNIDSILETIRTRSDCDGIVNGLRGMWTKKLHEVFPHSQIETQEWRTIQEKFFKD